VVRNFRVDPAAAAGPEIPDEVRERIGDVRVRDASEAEEWQNTIESAIGKSLGFR
jgi:hypothetical protein